MRPLIVMTSVGLVLGVCCCGPEGISVSENGGGDGGGVDSGRSGSGSGDAGADADAGIGDAGPSGADGGATDSGVQDTGSQDSGPQSDGGLTVDGGWPTIGFFIPGPSTVAALSGVLARHALASPDYGCSFSAADADAYPSEMERHLNFCMVTDGGSQCAVSVDDAIGTALAKGGTAKLWSVAYDAEPNNPGYSTPSVEYTGHVDAGVSAAAYYANQAALRARAVGLRFGIDPSGALYKGGQYPSMLEGLDFSTVDYWNMQIGDTTGDPQVIIDAVNTYAVPIKQSHPHVLIYAAVNEETSVNMTVAQVEQVVAALQGKVDGITFHRYSDAGTIDQLLTAIGR